jgi:UDP-N-acetylmuramoyl-tripeptide--D-alanyl-D-alanine ligase
MRGIAVSLGALTLADVAAATGAAAAAGAPSERALAGVSIDSRTLPAGALFVAIAGPRFDGHDFLAQAAGRGAAAALVHRDVVDAHGLPLLRVADTTRALADLSRHVRLVAAIPVVAITGSMGKTTTKEMTAALLGTRGPVLKTEGNLNNQYGLPLTLLRLAPEHRAAVLELGMSAAGELRLLSGIAQPDVAIITNVAPVHLEFFPSIEAIAAAKAEILEGLRPSGAAVLNGDDPRLRRVGEAFRGGDVLWFGHDRRFDVSAENWRGTPFGMRFDLRLGGRTLDIALPLPGPHFVMNFLAAAAAAHRLGVDPDAIAETATHMTAAAHRGQVLRLTEGVTLIDDCYNANPQAVEAAIVALEMASGARRVAVLGDMLELGPTGPGLHRQVGEAIAPRIDVLVGVGTLAGGFLEGARAAGCSAETLHAFPDAASAAAAITEIVRPGDAVLVKGSRGVHLEGIVDALTARFQAREG